MDTAHLDNQFMDRALDLAARGLFTTDPNPRVGCVIVSEGQIVGEGYHQRAGCAHAEVNALDQAQSQARGSTAYVTLEPCAHHGRTPPCAGALIEAGVARVVAATLDPYEQVSGKGIDALRDAGIQVILGVREAAARRINRGYLKRVSLDCPWIRLKLAMSLDGKTALASGDSQWITGSAARADVHQLRARSSAVLSSLATVTTDNASLNARIDGADVVQPIRVILDARLELSESAPCLRIPGPILLFSNQTAVRPSWMESRLEVRATKTDSRGHLDLHAIMKTLAKTGVNELHVEAGATLGGALVQAGLVDELVVYVAPDMLGPGARGLLQLPDVDQLADRYRFEFVDVRQIGADVRLTLAPHASSEGV